jgi:hypothetical protein
MVSHIHRLKTIVLGCQCSQIDPYICDSLTETGHCDPEIHMEMSLNPNTIKTKNQLKTFVPYDMIKKVKTMALCGGSNL